MFGFLRPHGLYTACHASPSFTISQSLLTFLSIESVMLSNHLMLCRFLLLLPSIFPSIRVFSSGSTLCIRWPKYLSFSLSISSSNGYSGLISFKIDGFDFLAAQGALKRHLNAYLSSLFWCVYVWIYADNRDNSFLYFT